MPPQAPPVENLEDANLSVLVTDAAGDNPIIYANPAFERLTGHERDELLGRNCRFLQGAGTDRDAVARLADALANRREIREVLLNYRKDGTLSWNELFIAPVRDENGLVVQFVGIQRDSTDRRRLVEELRRSEELHRSIIETAAEGICLIDARGLISFANPRLGEMLGVRLDSVVGTSYLSFLPVGMHERVAARFERPERAAVERDDIALRRPDGRALWVSVSSTSMPEAGGSAAGLLLMVADITERRRDEERLRFLADHDAVTGLLNRRQLYARLDQARAHHLRHHGTSALVLLDLDDFKLVNDARGHHAGDLVLRSVAGVLTAELR